MIARLPIRLVLGLFLAAGCSAPPGSHAHHGGPSAPPTSRRSTRERTMDES